MTLQPAQTSYPRALVPTEARPAFTDEQVALIKRTIAKDCTNDELSLFIQVCGSIGLDPFRKQIYAIKRGGQMTIQTGIDGYRLLAARTGELAGIDDPTYDTSDLTDEPEHPRWARVTVYRWSQGQRCAYTATARWTEYQQSGGNWGKMPYLMLGKCAEALALRRAFPAELSGVYTREEMDQADRTDETAPVAGPIIEERAVTRPAASAWKALKDPDIILLLQQMGKLSDPERVACVGLIKRELDEQGIPWTHETVLAALREEAVKLHDLHELGSEGGH